VGLVQSLSEGRGIGGVGYCGMVGNGVDKVWQFYGLCGASAS